MKEIVFLMLLLPLITASQVTEPGWENDPAKVFTRYETGPAYKNDPVKWKDFLQQHISLSAVFPTTTDSDYRKDSVAVKFVVTKDGTVNSIIPSYSSNDNLLKEFIRVLQLSSGNWTPPVNGSKLINGWYESWIVLICYKRANRSAITSLRLKESSRTHLLKNR